MERALVRFVGAGLASLAGGYGHSLPPGAVADGDGLVALLSARQIPDVPQLIADVTSDIRQERQRRNLPPELAELHLAALPEIMDRHRLAPELASGVIAAARESTSDDATRAGEHARWLANSFVAQARLAGDLERAQLTETAARFLIERVYARLLADADRLDRLMAAGLVNLIEAQASQEPPMVPEPPPRPAAPVPAEQVLRDLLAERIGDDRAQSVLAIKIAALDGLKAALAEPMGVHPEAIALRLRAAALLTMAGFAEAESCLSEAEGLDVRAAQTDMENTRTHMAAAAATRTARGEIDEILCAYRPAVRHYMATLRYLPGNDGPGRWRLYMQQAAALERLGEQFGDLAALDEATNVCWAALRLLPDGAAPRERASTQLMLGRLYEMLALGTGSRERERTAAAVAALRSLARSCERGQPELAAELVHRLARALWSLGIGSDDVAVLHEAAQVGLVALEGYEQVGDAVRADRARADLQRLQEAVAERTEPPEGADQGRAR